MEKQTGTPQRLPWVVGLVVVALVVIGLAYAVVRVVSGEETPDAPRDEPSVAASSAPAPTTPTPAAGAALALPSTAPGRCLVPTAEMLAAKPLAFAGTARSVAGGTAVLEPTEVFAGDPGAEVTVTGAVEDPALLEGTFAFVEGEEYLISAEADVVTVCGFSGPETPQLRSLYDRAFS